MTNLIITSIILTIAASFILSNDVKPVTEQEIIDELQVCIIDQNFNPRLSACNQSERVTVFEDCSYKTNETSGILSDSACDFAYGVN